MVRTAPLPPSFRLGWSSWKGPLHKFMYPANEKVARPVRADNLAEVVVATVEHDIFNGGGVQAFEFSTGKSRTIPSRVMV
jgi:hypothetical protein